MRRRSDSGQSKATQYRGNGRTYSQYGSSMFPREHTEEEDRIAGELKEKYKDILAWEKFVAGTNMGKPIWVIFLEDGIQIETNEGIHALEGEIINTIKRHYPETN